MTTVTKRAAYQFLPGPGAFEVPTILKEGDCQCSWVVVRAGPGLECISRLKRQSRACPHRHEVPEAGQ